ncbi:MAG: serine protein kinase RIO [archaeon]
MAKITRERFKTYQHVLDEFTIRTLYKLITQGHFEGLIGPVSTGKESNVFSAQAKTGYLIAKIYRLQTCDFNHMYDYIKYDPRYTSLKKQRRKVIFAWVQREFRNLHKAREAGVRVPTPLTFINNVLVMEMIGTPAPKLKDQPPGKPGKFFEKTVSFMKKLYRSGLVHGDLSEYNILNLNDSPVFIDFSHSTSPEGPGMELIERDIRNVCHYFAKHTTVDEKMVRKEIIGK